MKKQGLDHFHIFMLLYNTCTGTQYSYYGYLVHVRQKLLHPDRVALCAFSVSAVASTRAYPASLRRSRGGGLCMDASSCAPEITDDTFEAEVLNQEQPVLVFFRAPW